MSVLTDYEKLSPMWAKIRKHLEARLELLRSQNDASLDEARTAKLRGRIAEVKNLMSLGDPMTQENADES